MGMYGSPYANNDYFGIDHTLGTFSRYQTIEEQFTDLISTIHDLGGKVMLDTLLRFGHIGRKRYDGCYAETMPVAGLFRAHGVEDDAA